MRRILIIEDNVNDLTYYTPLYTDGNEVSFLFFSKDKKYTKEKLEDLVQAVHEELFRKVRKYFVEDEEAVSAFLKETPFDLYVIDSLSGYAPKLVKEAKLPKGKIAFFTSTEDFKVLMEHKEYKAYKKNEMARLMEENGLSKEF